MSSSVSILIVDDEPRNLDVLESILYSADYRLQRAGSANEALLALMNGDYAVLVLDINMPGMNGIELANLIKQRKRTQHIPILFLTAYYQDEQRVLEGYGVGAVDYLTKPVNPEILRSKVGVFVDLHRKTQALAAINVKLEQEILQRQQAEEALRRANNELEARVQQRTADLTRVNSALRESEARMQASEAHLRLVTDHASVFIAHLDKAYCYKFVNRAYAERYGLLREQILGAHMAEVLGKAAFETIRQRLDETLAGQRVDCEIQVPYAALGTRWIHVVFEPEHSTRGEVIGVVAVVSDITARKQAEQEVTRARDEALAASRAKDDFLAALSHELRTPLNPVLLLASDAAQNPNYAPEVRADFETILKNTTLEARLIDDLLDVTRITHGKLALERRPIDVHAVLGDALATIRSSLAEKNIDLNLGLDATDYTIIGDPVRLQQVFWNVLKNAVKFTDARGRIRVQTAPSTLGLRVSVRDSGIGMTGAELENIFKPFVQGDHAGGGRTKFGGLGLGLAITHTLVEMHGGRIKGESSGRGQGTTFVIDLPLATAAQLAAGSTSPMGESSRRAPPAPPAPPPARGSDKRGRVLVVDDHAPTLAILAQLLNRRRFDVISAGSLAQARSIANTEHFDLFISDIGLPDGNGCTLMAELRIKRPDLLGIALSGYGMEEDRERSRTAGFVEHLTKPVNVAALDSAISRVLGDQAGLAETRNLNGR
ncbi:MAG: sensor hybrid histidine kinase [Verrucomicrobia bacterium]|nr:sensor hybrid histidine kinase [Verrucomicrobiota bacterium]